MLGGASPNAQVARAGAYGASIPGGSAGLLSVLPYGCRAFQSDTARSHTALSVVTVKPAGTGAG
jgi:hypothetical protein